MCGDVFGKERGSAKKASFEVVAMDLIGDVSSKRDRNMRACRCLQLVTAKHVRRMK